MYLRERSFDGKLKKCVEKKLYEIFGVLESVFPRQVIFGRMDLLSIWWSIVCLPFVTRDNIWTGRAKDDYDVEVWKVVNKMG